jgi:hypothetical protein
MFGRALFGDRCYNCGAHYRTSFAQHAMELLEADATVRPTVDSLQVRKPPGDRHWNVPADKP